MLGQGFRHRSARPAAPDRYVRLLGTPRRAPATLAERSAVSLLTGQDAVSLALLVRGIARDLYRDTLRHGGWAAEIGDVGQALFVSDAERAVREADGVLWAIADGDADRRSATTS